MGALSDELFFMVIICVAAVLVLSKFFGSLEPGDLQELFVSLAGLSVVFVLVVFAAWGWVGGDARSRFAAKVLLRSLAVAALAGFGFLLVTARLSSWELAIGLLSAVFLLVYLTVVGHNALLVSRERRLAEWVRRDAAACRRHELLSFDIGLTSDAVLSKRLEEIDHLLMFSLDAPLRAQRQRICALLEERAHARRLRDLAREKDQLTRHLAALAQEKRRAEETAEERSSGLARAMELETCPVFLKDELADEQIALLQGKGFVQANEYCAFAHRLVTAFVRPAVQQGVTHTFLVWSVQQAIEALFDVEDLRVHETRDADLTFTVDKKTYAIEIETGSLLRKRRQLEEKVAALKKKYGDRWLFIVSNKRLVPKYRRFGVVATRKDAVRSIGRLIGDDVYPDVVGAHSDVSDDNEP